MATDKKPKQGSTDNTAKGPKVDRLRERGKARQSALERYAEKLRESTPRQRFLMRLNSVVTLVENSLRGHSPNSLIYKNMLKIKEKALEVTNFVENGLEDSELVVQALWEKDIVVLKHHHKTPTLKKYAGKQMRVKFSNEDVTTVRVGKEEIDIKTSLLRRITPE
jgi:hypothetical protein